MVTGLRVDYGTSENIIMNEYYKVAVIRECELRLPVDRYKWILRKA